MGYFERPVTYLSGSFSLGPSAVDLGGGDPIQKVKGVHLLACLNLNSESFCNTFFRVLIMSPPKI